MDKAKILIVDDDPICTGLLLAILGDEFHVTTTNSGSCGLELLRSMPQDLLLLDITMPDVNGYHVLKDLRQQAEKLTTPVVVISSLVEQPDQDFAIKLGANDYLTKPVSPQALQEMLDKHIDR